ncbi:hypothetical protein BU15DRAFT_68025 [Melanogaster broomeanus]|nr:hypothetical protein BU15DRAFT_68025 [Melanogaster broomeanus]
MVHQMIINKLLQHVMEKNPLHDQLILFNEYLIHDWMNWLWTDITQVPANHWRKRTGSSTILCRSPSAQQMDVDKGKEVEEEEEAEEGVVVESKGGGEVEAVVGGEGGGEVEAVVGGEGGAEVKGKGENEGEDKGEEGEQQCEGGDQDEQPDQPPQYTLSSMDVDGEISLCRAVVYRLS